MKKTIGLLIVTLFALVLVPARALAAGVSASGGGAKTVGQTFNISIVASGVSFNAFQGNVATTGPVSIVSVSAGNANWINQPSANGTFSGALLGQKVSSFTIATIKLKANSAGSGAVTVSGVILKDGAATVGTTGGSASYTITKAPELPGAVTVTSTSHPDQNASYETTTISLSWNKESGIDAFSYLLDQTATTTPAAQTTDANTSATYADKAIGTYYFHIRAHKTDGWGTATHFKINIKEPDAKVDTSLAKPSNIKIQKSNPFVNNVKDGTVSGILISGKTLAGYKVNLAFTPQPTLSEGQTFSVVSNASGEWKYLLSAPVKSGFYKVSVQGQKDKVLTPSSDEIRFEITQAKGGDVHLLTDDDALVKTNKVVADLKTSGLSDKAKMIIGGIALALAIAGIALYVRIKRKR